MVVSNRAYTADIKIYTSFRKLVHSSVQKFGFCGELDNPARYNSGLSGYGAAGWLVWNLRDPAGRLVVPEIYTWEIEFDFADSQSLSVTHKQGVTCNYRLDFCPDGYGGVYQ